MFRTLDELHRRSVRRRRSVAISAAVECLENRTLLSAAGYHFSPLAYLGDPAPGGGDHVNDFEVGSLNNAGTVGFVSDVSTDGEGAFLGHWRDPGRIQHTPVEEVPKPEGKHTGKD